MHQALERILRQLKVMNAVKQTVLGEHFISSDPPSIAAIRSRVSSADFREMVRTQILCELPQPACCTVEDIIEVASAHLSFGIGESFDNAYDRMVIDLTNRAGTLNSGSFFCLKIASFVSSWQYDRKDPIYWFSSDLALAYGFYHEASSGEETWTSEDADRIFQRFLDDGHEIGVINAGERELILHEWLLSPDSVDDKPISIKTFVRGKATMRAIAEATREVYRVCDSIMRLWTALPDLALESHRITLEPAAFTDPADHFLTACLDAFYSISPPKNSLARRLKNAMHLLVQADAQEVDGVALSLAFAAIEALVCVGSSEVVGQLSRNCAALLIDEPGARLKAIEYVKKLYNLRCKVVHGEEPFVVNRNLIEVRALASQVIAATIEWMSFNKRFATERDSVKEFVGEMEDALVGGRIMNGVRPIRSRYFCAKVFQSGV